MKWTILYACLTLSACATPVVQVKITCLPMPAYTEQQKADLKAAYDGLAAYSPLRLAVQDLLTLRNENRACQAP